MRTGARQTCDQDGCDRSCSGLATELLSITEILLKVQATNRWLAFLDHMSSIRQSVQELPKVGAPPFLDSDTRVTVSEAARRAAEDARARDAHVLKDLVRFDPMQN